MISNEITKAILKTNTEESIGTRIDEAKHEYVDSDWANDFDDFEEAYVETGRGAAESQVLGEVINSFDSNLNTDVFCTVFDELKSFWNLSTD